MAFFDWLSTTALSFTISGNTGISPFMSLFLVGILAKTNPDLLQMDGTIEWILSSWFSIVIWGILMVLEFVGKCIPVVDEMIDAAMTFVVPVFSILGSLSTFGLFTAVNNGESLEDGDDQGRRTLSIASSALWFLQFSIVGVGIILALCMHGIKMLVRLLGEGWLTYCLTVIETIWVVTSIVLAVFVRQVAIVIAILICAAAGYNVKKKFFDKDKASDAAEHPLYSTMGEETIVATTTTITKTSEGKVTEQTVMIEKTEV